MLSRRQLMFAATAAVTIGASRSNALVQRTKPLADRRIFKSLKLGMFASELPLAERFASLREAGFDGVEIDAPNGPDPAACAAASAATGLRVDGTVGGAHWRVRLTDPDPSVRAEAVNNLKASIRAAEVAGGDTVLVVPGHGNDGSVEEVEARAEAGIRQALPLAAKLGVALAIENVWNHMFYDHDGPANQTANRLAAFVDRFASPRVGVQFDIGNHQKYGPPGEWIRTLGRRIVKLDIKDWGESAGFGKIGEGDVDWAAVRAALADIEYAGWAAAEVAGGDAGVMRDIAKRMDAALGL